MVKQMDYIQEKIKRIETNFNNIPLNLYLVTGEKNILIDTGCAYMVDSVIIPFLNTNEINPESLDVIINTHAHFDHIGGNSQLKKMFDLNIMATSESAKWIEDHEKAFHEYHLYIDLIPYTQEYKKTIMNWMGKEEKVDTIISDTYTITTNPFNLKAMSARGHADGGTMLFEKEYGFLICGDALQGRGIETKSDLIAPEYRELDGYLDTLNKVRHLTPDIIFPAHFPPIQGKKVNKFLSDCKITVEKLHDSVKKALNTGKNNLLDLSKKVSTETGYNLNLELLTSVHSHIKKIKVITKEQ